VLLINLRRVIKGSHKQFGGYDSTMRENYSHVEILKQQIYNRMPEADKSRVLK